ncbi:Lysine-specific demethylase 3A [Neolecta irregularis DAH-3]|uniref:Lysine-specific demethylase 3A n=1 Tax=Neolecta irregularis (strain DAH-3) TaxID=1198029 RepID=A0A1U7LKY2_NEOID|nr:Lysine-specific demethylase 3A [Neolecta irregularis DAH-3]|eukprot:OLL23307.1 Lysine-specific demethylase 3A [Neolecta irregularis DAH-3]
MSVLENFNPTKTQTESTRGRNRRSKTAVNYREVQESDDGLDDEDMSQQRDNGNGQIVDGLSAGAENISPQRKIGNIKRKKRSRKTGSLNKKQKTSTKSSADLYGPLPISQTTQSWLQNMSCQRLRQLPQCQSCIIRQASLGSCRFNGFRLFDSQNGKPINVDQYAFASLEDAHEIVFEPSFTTDPSDDSRSYAMRIIAPFFHDVLMQELKHEQQSTIIRRPREKGIRPLCDTCATTIFSGFWFCYVCGKEFCLDCYDEWDESCIEKYHENLQRCSRRRKHRKEHLIPLTRFKSKEISELLTRVCEIEKIPLTPVVLQKSLNFQQADQWTAPVVQVPVDILSESDFRSFWRQGVPFMLHNVGKGFKLNWDADYFIQHYGKTECYLVNCQTGADIQATVQEFFENFKEGIFRGKTQNLKLKDWPPTEDFSTAFPDLFEDFQQALPFPSYTRRTGYYNLNSRFPPDYLVPDLGPKMYIAYPSSDDIGGKGTTNLHLDMTDAINIMVHAVENPDKKGCAVWDIFSALDTDKIRRFLLEKFPKMNCDDPIHRQQHYLTTDQLKELSYEYGVQSYRMYQNPGDAVFIPAGCAHQVCNLSSCIKVACDFVSPENVSRCAVLTDESRRLAKDGKREDVLQLKNILYFAWKQMDRESRR